MTARNIDWSSCPSNQLDSQYHMDNLELSKWLCCWKYPWYYLWNLLSLHVTSSRLQFEMHDEIPPHKITHSLKSSSQSLEQSLPNSSSLEQKSQIYSAILITRNMRTQRPFYEKSDRSWASPKRVRKVPTEVLKWEFSNFSLLLPTLFLSFLLQFRVSHLN